jgi:hypothetical protein
MGGDVSGQLVGEVLDAIESGAIGLAPQNQRWALVAIAEKCHTKTRQGSVRFDRIKAVVGKSTRTTRRALAELKDAGLIRVVKPGFKAHGKAMSPIYELAAELVPSKSGTTHTAEVVPSAAGLVPNPNGLVPSMDGPLDGSLDGSLDRARDPWQGAAAPPRRKEDARTLAQIMGRYNREGHPKPPRTPEQEPVLRPEWQAAIDDARERLDREEQLARQEDIA